jgi:Uma2 family endonuclease
LDPSSILGASTKKIADFRLKSLTQSQGKNMGTTTHLMTAEDLFHLPDDGFRHELIKGELLTMSPPGEEHGAVTMNLSFLLGQYVRPGNLGTLYLGDTGFKLESDPDTVLAPDIAFIRRERVGTLSKTYRSGAPDLAVEVLSPGDRKGKVEEKTTRWLALGALAVWLVNPQTRTVDVRLVNGETRLLTENDDLTGDSIVPGFRIPVSEIFG